MPNLSGECVCSTPTRSRHTRENLLRYGPTNSKAGITNMLNKIGVASAIALAVFSLASPAMASSAVMCEGKGGEAVVNLSTMSVVQVIGAYAKIGDAAYSTGPERGEGAPFAVGQAFGEGDAMMIDFVDTNFEDILVGLRLNWQRDDEIWIGTLTSGDTTVEVSCTSG